MTELQPCMGGWCAKRNRCQHYHAESSREPAERLCEPGDDGGAVMLQRAVPAGAWERPHARMLAPASWVDGLGASA